MLSLSHHRISKCSVICNLLNDLHPEQILINGIEQPVRNVHFCVEGTSAEFQIKTNLLHKAVIVLVLLRVESTETAHRQISLHLAVLVTPINNVKCALVFF